MTTLLLFILAVWGLCEVIITLSLIQVNETLKELTKQNRKNEHENTCDKK